MFANTKFVVRPKVRFCQPDVDESNAQELKNSVNQKNSIDSNKPKIRSIVTLSKPVILRKSNKSSSNLENKELKSTDSIQRTNLLSESSNAVSSIQETAPVVTDTCCNIETPLPLNNLNNTQNTSVHSEETKKLKGSDKSLIDSLANSSASTMQEETSNKVLKSQNSVKTNLIKRDKRGKENNALFLKKGINNNVKRSTDLKMKQCKVKPCSNNVDNKKINIAKESTASLTSKRLKTKPIVDVMPCYKYNTVVSKIKASPIKKIMVRDIVGPKVKPYIGSGVPRKKQDILKISEVKEKSHITPCIFDEKLAKPEYNSIMCTINKLNEIKKQKTVIDLEHLSPAYKNLINGKISNALDFPLDEAVYKNLVDLSIDEKQLPSRLIRSKDPEPRQRDIVPVLSDFFIPEPTEEYYTPVSIKPRAVETIDSWSAFRISDKIFEWKHSLDHV